MRNSFYWMCITQRPRTIGDKLTRKEQPEEERRLLVFCKGTERPVKAWDAARGVMYGGRGETCARDEAATAMLSNAWAIWQQRRARLRCCQFSRLAPLTLSSPTWRTNSSACLSLSLSRPPLPFPLLCACVPLSSPHNTTYYSTTPPFKCRPAKTITVHS